MSFKEFSKPREKWPPPFPSFFNLLNRVKAGWKKNLSVFYTNMSLLDASGTPIMTKTTPFESLLIFCQLFISPPYFQLLLQKWLSQKWCRNSKTFKNFIYSWWIWCLFKSSYPCHYNLLAGRKSSSLVFSLVLCLKDLKIYLHYFLTYIYVFFLFFFYIPDSVFPSIICWPLLFCVSFRIN